MVPVVREDARELLVDVFNDLIGLAVENLQLAWVGLNSSVVSPDVIGPPSVCACHDIGINSLPTRHCMAGHVRLGDHTNCTLLGILDHVVDIVMGESLRGRICVERHAGVNLHHDRP